MLIMMMNIMLMRIKRIMILVTMAENDGVRPYLNMRMMMVVVILIRMMMILMVVIVTILRSNEREQHSLEIWTWMAWIAAVVNFDADHTGMMLRLMMVMMMAMIMMAMTMMVMMMMGMKTFWASLCPLSPFARHLQQLPVYICIIIMFIVSIVIIMMSIMMITTRLSWWRFVINTLSSYQLIFAWSWSSKKISHWLSPEFQVQKC